MTIRALLFLAALLAAWPAAARAGGAKRPPSLGDLRKVGTAKIANSCSRKAQRDLSRSVALLHSFFYEEARRGFEAAAAKDPSCALASWGIAMTHWHPLWTPPSDSEMQAGLAAAERAESLGGGKKPVEKGLIRALLAFYRAPSQPGGDPAQTCHGPSAADHRSRALAYEKAMAELHAERPKDVEIATFYALALIATAPPTDKTLANQKKATEILEGFWKKRRNHPGIAHYLIHGYDSPELAGRGLPAARAYASMAPWVPHVLHMPAHIFTRLGMWNEVIEANLASAEAARQYAATWHPDATSFEELHALDYLIYGHLQRGDDVKAKEVVTRAAAVRKTHPEVDFVLAYALGAIPSRHALERRAWDEASAIEVSTNPSLARFAFAEGHVAFARALGAARRGRIDEARRALERLESLAASAEEPRFQYFAKQIQTQVVAVRGWIAFAEGKKENAETLLVTAADADDLLGKHPVSPGSLLPARELLADFLIENGRFGEARYEYEKTLALSPNRLNSLYGAAVAADRNGDKVSARRYYERIVEIASPDSPRAEVAAAKSYLGGS